MTFRIEAFVGFKRANANETVIYADLYLTGYIMDTLGIILSVVIATAFIVHRVRTKHRTMNLVALMMGSMQSTAFANITIERPAGSVIFPVGVFNHSIPNEAIKHESLINDYIKIWVVATELAFKTFNVRGYKYVFKVTYIGTVVGDDSNIVGYQFRLDLSVNGVLRHVEFVTPNDCIDQFDRIIKMHSIALDNTCSLLIAGLGKRTV